VARYRVAWLSHLLHKLHESDAITPQTPLEQGLRSYAASLVNQA
jgi:hypothetical protein